MPASGKIVASDTMIALPIAVARCNWKRSIAASRSSRLCVGDCTTCAVPANETIAMRVLRGWSAMNWRAAACAAVMRLGFTSSASMLREMSMASTTRSCCDGSVITAVGRAMATRSSVSASTNSSGGM